jgi:hypothetical protein
VRTSQETQSRNCLNKISRRKKYWPRVPDGWLTPKRTGRRTVDRNSTSTSVMHIREGTCLRPQADSAIDLQSSIGELWITVTFNQKEMFYLNRPVLFLTHAKMWIGYSLGYQRLLATGVERTLHYFFKPMNLCNLGFREYFVCSRFSIFSAIIALPKFAFKVFEKFWRTL